MSASLVEIFSLYTVSAIAPETHPIPQVLISTLSCGSKSGAYLLPKVILKI